MLKNIKRSLSREFRPAFAVLAAITIEAMTDSGLTGAKRSRPLLSPYQTDIRTPSYELRIYNINNLPSLLQYLDLNFFSY
jgi:hypothetical protein